MHCIALQCDVSCAVQRLRISQTSEPHPARQGRGAVERVRRDREIFQAAEDERLSRETTTGTGGRSLVPQVRVTRAQ